MKVTYYPDAQLFLVAKSLLVINDNVSLLIISMKELMFHEVGIGLSGIQVNLNIRLMIMSCSGSPMTIVNPQMISKSSDTIKYQEGCLSIPSIIVSKKRLCCVVLQFLGAGINYQQKKVLSKRFFNVLVVCFQHEMDHLNGRIIVRRI